MSKRAFPIAIVLAAMTMPASAQLLGGGPIGPVGGVIGGPVGGVIDQTVGTVDNSVGQVAGDSGLTRRQVRQQTNPALLLDRVSPPVEIGLAPAELLARIRRARHAELIKAHKNLLDRDPAGQPVRKATLVAIDPDPVSLAAAGRLGFRIAGDERQAELGIRMVTLALPRGMVFGEAMKKLSRAAPNLQFDYYLFS